MGSARKPQTVLGLDCSTQSLTGVLLDAGSGEVLATRTLAYRDDPRLAGRGFEHDSMVIPPREPGEAEQPPRLFVAALEALFDDLKAAGVDFSVVAAINTSGQQHGHVYLSPAGVAAFAALRSNEDGSDRRSLDARLSGAFAYGGAPIWKTANTAAESAEIRAALGGSAAAAECTGSDVPLRFSCCAQRRLSGRWPEAWARTACVQQISSLIPAVLSGDARVATDFGNACGTGWMNYRERRWDDAALAACAGDRPGGAAALRAALPELVHPQASVGRVTAWFVRRYGFEPTCRVLAGSGDNPQSKVLADSDLVSLGTSFVFMFANPRLEVDRSGAANAMYDGLGRPFMFACRTNGALAWDRLRALHGVDPKDYVRAEAALAAVPPASVLRLWQPDAESFPAGPAHIEVLRRDDGPADFAHDYAGAVDSALGLMWLNAERLAGTSTVAPLTVCGGPTASAGILKRVAAIWKRPVAVVGAAGAALGAAVAAAVALVPESEREHRAAELRAACASSGRRVEPDPNLIVRYHGGGGEPGWLARLARSF